MRYSVNADDPASVRYQHVWQDMLKQRGVRAFAETYGEWQLWLSAAFPDLFADAKAAKTYEDWYAALQLAHPEIVEEAKALSKLLMAEDPSEALFLPEAIATLTSVYPIMNTSPKNTTDTRPSACTSLLVQQIDGTVLHGRSLDYEPRSAMAQSTVLLDFQYEGSLAYSCLYPLVYPTALQWFTCVRPGAFSLSVNARSQGVHNEHNTSFKELMRRVTSPGALLLGEAAEQAMMAKSYEEALARLASLPVVSSNYYILGGPHGQGSIVTRYGNVSSADLWSLGDSSSPLSDGQPAWMRVQTNVDHWVPFESGAYATHRRQRAVDLLTGLGADGVDKDSLFRIYHTDHARKGSENRTTPEDTGVILRPSTIASLIMEPGNPKGVDLSYWRLWATDPAILPPQKSSGGIVLYS